MTAVVFSFHLIVERYFSWKDKPMMPNFFTFLLLPGYRVGMCLPLNHSIQLAVGTVLDWLLFSGAVWLLFALRRRIATRA